MARGFTLSPELHAQLPREIGGMVTDVIETGPFVAFAPKTPIERARSKLSPVLLGSSVGFDFPPASTVIMAGTLGALVARGAHRGLCMPPPTSRIFPADWRQQKKQQDPIPGGLFWGDGSRLYSCVGEEMSVVDTFTHPQRWNPRNVQRGLRRTTGHSLSGQRTNQCST